MPHAIASLFKNYRFRSKNPKSQPGDMKKLLKTTVIANTPCCENADKIRGWVESNGGKYTTEISANVTHLLTSKKAWAEYTPIVKAARRQKTIFVVKDTWIHDVFLNKKLLPEAAYSWDQRHAGKVNKHRDLLVKQQRTKKAKARRQELSRTSEDLHDNLAGSPSTGTIDDSNSACSNRSGPPQEEVPNCTKAASCISELSQPSSRIATSEVWSLVEHMAGTTFDKACLEVERDMALAGYHVYINTAGFAYLIQLLRHDAGMLIQEKHNLKLYESNITPYTYAVQAVYIKCTRKRIPKAGHSSFSRWNTRQAEVVELVPRGSEWVSAYDAFCGFFKKKTGQEWTGTQMIGDCIKDGSEAPSKDIHSGEATVISVSSSEGAKVNKEEIIDKSTFSSDQKPDQNLHGAYSVSGGRSNGPRWNLDTISPHTNVCRSANTQLRQESSSTAALTACRPKHGESESDRWYFKYIPYSQLDGTGMHITGKLREQCAKAFGEGWDKIKHED